MTSLEEWGVPLAVLGLLLLTLFMAALHRRYQAYLAGVRLVVGQLDARIHEIATALDELAKVPLSRELRLTLRSDILVRYQKIRSLYRHYPGIVDSIRRAERAMDAEGAPTGKGVGPLEGEKDYRKTVAALNRLHAVLRPGGTLQPLPADVRKIFVREIGERRAELMSRFHLVEARRLQQRGNSMKARTHLLALLQGLRQHGPNTGFVRELAAEADAALADLNQPLGIPGYPDKGADAA